MGLAQQALEVAPVKVRELKKYFSLSDYTDLSLFFKIFESV
jgi:hypothetical protein